MSSIRNRLFALKGATPPPAPGSPAPAIPRRRVLSAAQQFFPADNLAEGDGFVARAVRLADTESETTRAGSEFVHVSALVRGDFCPRAHLIHQRHNHDQQVSVLSQMRIVWELGRAAENHVRKQFIRMHGMHRVIGKWRCPCEATEHCGNGNPHTLCQSCGKPVDIYGELDLFDQARNLGGHPDLLYLTRSGGLEVVEIKSIRKEDFSALLRPAPEHVLQCWSYLRILRETTPGVTVNGRVLYVAKDYIQPKVSPYLEFPLPPKPQILDLLEAQAAEAASHQKAGTLPPRLDLCTGPLTKRAKGCDACALCFSLT